MHSRTSMETHHSSCKYLSLGVEQCIDIFYRSSNEWKDNLQAQQMQQPLRASGAVGYDSNLGQQQLMDIQSPHSLNGAIPGRAPSHFQYQVPVKPMFGMQGMAPQSAPAKNNKRQVIQQIIHNNGSGNILFSSGNAYPVPYNIQNKRAQQVGNFSTQNNVGKAY